MQDHKNFQVYGTYMEILFLPDAISPYKDPKNARWDAASSILPLGHLQNLCRKPLVNSFAFHQVFGITLMGWAVTISFKTPGYIFIELRDC